MKHFDAYGKLAESDVEDACQNGRYAIQGDAQHRIPADVIGKLKIQSTDRFLDIGCGLGLNLEPIAQIALLAVGIDHPNVVAKAQARIQADNVRFIGDNFLSATFEHKFEKVLAYSVLPSLPDAETMMLFVDRALSLLAPNGRMVLGDLANQDKKGRFSSSGRGQAFIKDWQASFDQQSSDEKLSAFTEASPTVVLNDDVILDLVKHIRRAGFHAYLVDQPQDLPFGNSREDVLVVGPEYAD